jgi:hypothetical protein
MVVFAQPDPNGLKIQASQLSAMRETSSASTLVSGARALSRYVWVEPAGRLCCAAADECGGTAAKCAFFFFFFF